jgi:ABC-2 type transport system ATP-binding protein
MRQKLALARALLHNPPVLLLDEPTSAMDPESARLVRDAIHSLRSANRAIIICTHNLPEAEELADQIAIIRRGRIIARGSPNELKEELLGSPEYEMRLGGNLNGCDLELPAQITLTGCGQDWLRYRATNLLEANPILLRSMLERNIPVISLQEVSQSLEKAYLQAIAAPDDQQV